MSTRPVVFNLVNCIIGVSVLAMPFCFQECGIVLCAVAILFSAWLTKKSCGLLLKAGQVARRRNYEGLALSTYGAPGKFAVELSIIGLLIGTLIAFNVIIGDLVPSIFHNLSGVQVSWTIRAVLMTLLAFGVGFPLSMMRNLHSLSNFSALSLGFYMLFVLQIILSALPKIMEGSWIYNLNYWQPEKLLHYLPIFALAFACHPQLFALYETLPEPSVKNMEGVVNTGINIVASVYFLVGLFGYVCFYNVGIKGDMLNNYGNTFLSYVIRLGFVMSVIVSFPLMVYPLRASLHSLIFQEKSSSSENLPGGAGFIPPDRFTYLTLIIISGTLMLGILFPQIEFVLALTGATMGTMIAFVYPSSMFLHAVSEKTNARLIAKLVLVLGLVCFVAGTYTVLMSQESGEHHQVDIHPPGIDPIKSMASHDSPQKTNDTNIKVGGIKGDPVDIDVAKIGIGGGDQLKENEKLKAVANDVKPNEAKPLDVKPVNAANDGLLKKAEEPAKPVEGEVKRQEPPVPHAPQDNPAQNAAAPDQRKSEDEHMNEKRQLMSQGEKDKSNPENLVARENNLDGVAARNVADANQVKVSEQEIDAELKKLEQSDKVPSDTAVMQTKDTARGDSALNEANPQQDNPEKSLVKRDLQLSHDPANVDDKFKAGADKAVGVKRNGIVVSQTAGNQSILREEENEEAGNKNLHEPLQSLDERTLGNNNKTTVEEKQSVEHGIKIRDLKSKQILRGKHSSSLSSKSFKTFLSKRNTRRSKRSHLQGEAR